MNSCQEVRMDFRGSTVLRLDPRKPGFMQVTLLNTGLSIHKSVTIFTTKYIQNHNDFVFFPQVFSVMYFASSFILLSTAKTTVTDTLFLYHTVLLRVKFNFYSLELEWFLSGAHRCNFPFNIFCIFIHFY